MRRFAGLLLAEQSDKNMGLCVCGGGVCDVCVCGVVWCVGGWACVHVCAYFPM